MRRAARALGAALLAAGAAAQGACTLAPRYERPDAPVAAQFAAAGEPSAGAGAADVGWREFFTDEALQQLIARALANNRDLRIAVLNVETAQAQYRIRRADLFPGLDAELQGSAQRVPATTSTTGSSYVAREYTVGLGAPAFELDLFGRVRSLRSSALEQYLALDETRSATELALIGEVANAWLVLLADRESLRLSRETLASQSDSLALTKLRFDSGVVGEVDLHQSEIAVHDAEVNIAVYTRRVAQDRNALELLVGEPLPAEVDAEQPPLEQQLLEAPLPAGLPADLLERRPDIRAAEHALKAANADIGAARAAFFPRITLTGFGGLANPELGDLFDSGGRTWSFSPRLTVPIFAGGANNAALDVAALRKRIEISRYEQTIQTAFREVSDGLAARAALEQQLAAQMALTAAAEASYRLADMRYRGGVESHLTALIAQRDLYTAQRALIDTRAARAANLVTLYKALGGGASERSP
jgi:multidrug efflux system outer membrane protein